MKNKKKTIVIGLVVLVILVISLVLVLLLNKKEPISTSPETHQTILNISSYDISSVRLINETDDLTFLKNQLEDGTQFFELDLENPAGNYSSTKIMDFVSQFLSVTYDLKIDDVTDLSMYGLDDPIVKLEITMQDGSVHVLSIGDATIEGYTCYATIDGSSSVFTIPTIIRTRGMNTISDFIEPQILSIDQENLAQIRFERDTSNEESDNYLNLLANSSKNEFGYPEYTFIEPINIKASDNFGTLVESLLYLTVDSFFEPTEEEMSLYELDKDPYYRFSMTLDDGTEIILNLSRYIGDGDIGFYYGTCSTFDGYFKISQLTLSGLDVSMHHLLDEYVHYCQITDISSMDVEFDDSENSIDFDLDLEIHSTIANENSEILLDTRNALVMNSDGRYYGAILFESISCIEISGVDMDTVPSFDPFMTITIVDNNHHITTLDFVEYPDNNQLFYVYINGEPSSILVNQNELFEDGGQDTFSYGIIPAYHLLDTAIMNSVNGIYDIPEG